MADDESYIRSIPWCGELLKDESFVNVEPWNLNPTLVPVSPVLPQVHGASPRAAPSTSAEGGPSSERWGDVFFKKTLRMNDTMGAFVFQHTLPAEVEPASPPAVASSADEALDLQMREMTAIRRVRAFIALGAGAGGNFGMAHGGLTATVLDEVGGMLMQTNAVHARLRARERAAGAGGGPAHAAADNVIVTRDLTIQFRRPVPIPGVVLVTAWFKDDGKVEEVESKRSATRPSDKEAKKRRIVVLGDVRDDKGTVLALMTATSMVLVARPKL